MALSQDVSRRSKTQTTAVHPYLTALPPTKPVLGPQRVVVQQRNVLYGARGQLTPQHYGGFLHGILAT